MILSVMNRLGCKSSLVINSVDCDTRYIEQEDDKRAELQTKMLRTKRPRASIWQLFSNPVIAIKLEQKKM